MSAFGIVSMYNSLRLRGVPEKNTRQEVCDYWGINESELLEYLREGDDLSDPYPE